MKRCGKQFKRLEGNAEGRFEKRIEVKDYFPGFDAEAIVWETRRPSTPPHRPLHIGLSKAVMLTMTLRGTEWLWRKMVSVADSKAVTVEVDFLIEFS
jgi:hypothetical protein